MPRARREGGFTLIERAPRVQPQLLILSSGELSPFSLTFIDQRPGGSRWVVSSDGFSMPRAEPEDARR